MRTYLKGSFWKRLVAFVIDELIVLFGLFILLFVLDLIGIKTEGIIDKVIFWIFSVVYNSVFIYKSGATLGKRLLRLRVANTEYKPINLSQALSREFGKMINATFLFCLGYIQALRNPQRQAWHDKTAKTYVVAVNEKGELIPTAEETVSRKDKIAFWLLFLIAITPFLLALLVIIYLFFASPNQIKGAAMAPNYTEGQYVLTDKMAYRTGQPQRGDVIIFPDVKGRSFDNIKRVIGLPGEKAKISGGKVYINGKELDESAYLDKSVGTGPESFLAENQEVTVPENQYFVLGDNRPHSSDSRDFGFVPKEGIIGKVGFCYWNCNSSK